MYHVSAIACSLLSPLISLPYRPKEASMGACSSSIKTRGVGGCIEELLDWFDYPHASAHPVYEVNCYWLSKQHHFIFFAKLGQPSCGESCIVLENRRTHNLIAKPWVAFIVALCVFHAACEERCRRGYSLVPRPFVEEKWPGS